MERKFILNYNELNSCIIEWQKNSTRTDGELTIFRDNCKKQLRHTQLDPEKRIIIINELTWDITINWEKGLEDKFYMIPTWYKISNKSKLYRQIKDAMNEAENRWIYDKIFKEVKE